MSVLRAFALSVLVMGVIVFGVTPASALAALETTIDSGPAGPTNDPTPTFTFSSADPNAIAFDCSVDADTVLSCSSPFTTQSLAEGSHTFSVTARDAAGNVGDPQVQSFVVDITPPVATIDSGPAGPTNDPTPTFTFSSTDPNALAFDCAVDGDIFLSCSSPFTTQSLAEGSHTFSVTPRDAAGNVGAPQARAVVVDITPPVATIDSGPPPFTNSTSATFIFSGTDDLSPSHKLVLQCRLSFQALAPCPSPKEYTALPEAQYTLRLRATDEAGNVSAAAIYAWTVDLTPPDTAIDAGPPDPTNDSTATVTFASDDPNATFECNVDAQGFVPCSSPWVSGTLSDGSHTFEVRARDLAGNVDASPAVIGFTVDTTPPPPVTDTPPSSSPAPPGAAGPGTTSKPPARTATSFVLIAKRTIRVARSRVAPLTLNCAGSKDCAGVVRLTTARPVRVSSARGQKHLSRKRRGGRDRRRRRARVVRLGSARFVIPARKTAQVKVSLSPRSYRLVKKLGRVKVLVTVRQRDRAGHLRISRREILLTAR